MVTKGYIKPKAEWRAVGLPKKRTNGSPFFAVKNSYVLTSKAVHPFFGRIYGYGAAGAPICFRFNTTFR